jgi:hypothetical protein
MSGIFDALPGIEVPVGTIASGLAAMWEGEASSGRPAPEGDISKATQVNFVLHLGLRTDAEDAVRQFEVAVGFSRRYPCRVVVLCPQKEDAGDVRAKVYGECTVGKSKEDTRCCEFVMLSYPRWARPFLEGQVSICLSADLPLYYWAHRFVDAARLADYGYLLANAKRVIIDSAQCAAGADALPWPHPENVRDLAFSRLLPVRQAIGQFLSRYPAGVLGPGLGAMRLRHGAAVAAEARVLFAWAKDRVDACGASGEASEVCECADIGPRAFELGFTYPDARRFSWKADLDSSHAVFDADFGSGRALLTTTVCMLAQEDALSEAMFF